MVNDGEWTQKGATLSNKTAEKEYGVGWDFIRKGIQTEQLEYQNGAMYGNPYVKVLRRQLESYIAQELGEDYLAELKRKTELKKVKREITSLKRKLKKLDVLRAELETVA